MFLGDVLKFHPLPKAIRSLLKHQLSDLNNAGVSGCTQHCWVLSNRVLYLWKYMDGANARLVALNVPHLGAARCFVNLISQPSSSTVSVVLCTSSGQLLVWLDPYHNSLPFDHQLFASNSGEHRVVAAFSAQARNEASDLGFFAIAATVDGSLYWLQGSTEMGLYSKRFHTPKVPTDDSLGLIGKLQRLCQTAYADAFDPLAHYKLQRTQPSSNPALSIQLFSVDSHKWKVFVLTGEALDCWMVTLGVRPSEQLLWSYNLLAVLQSALRCRDVSIVAMDVSPEAQRLFVWSSTEGRDGATVSAMHSMSLKSETVPWKPDGGTLTCPELDAGMQRGGGDAPGWQLLYNHGTHRCLLAAPGGCVAEWCPASGACRLLSQDADNLGAACSTTVEAGAAAPWLLLNCTYGVLEVASDAADLEDGSWEGPLTAELEAAVGQLLNATITQRLYGAAVPELQRRLQSLHVLSNPEAMATLARFSTALVDRLPKHWAAAGMLEPSADASVAAALSEKEVQHSALVDCLAGSGCLQKLLERAPATLRVLLDDAEKLAAVLEVRRLQDDMAGAPPGVAAPGAAKAIFQVITRAGELLHSQRQEQYQGWELFYACPSQSCSALFQAVTEAARQLLADCAQGHEPRAVLDGALQLGRLLLSALSAATAKRQQLQRSYELRWGLDAGVDWQADTDCMAALAQLLRLCEEVRARRPSEELPMWQERTRLTVELADRLLPAHAVAVVRQAGVQPKAEQLAKYWAERELVLSALVEDVMLERERIGGPNWQQPDSSLFWTVESLAAAHHAYPQLYRLLTLPNEPAPEAAEARLHRHMKALQPEHGAAPDESFARYVFQQLFEQGGRSWGQLVRLPGEFHHDLRSWLSTPPRGRVDDPGELRRLQLLYMLLVRDEEHAAAAEAALQLGLRLTDSLEERKHYVARAVLCGRAGGAAGTALVAEGELRLVEAQEALGLGPRPPMDVLEVTDAALALGGQAQGPVIAVQALTARDPQLKDQPHVRPRWEAAWRQAVEVEDWEALGQAREQMSDDQWLRSLGDTALYGAVEMAATQREYALPGGSGAANVAALDAAEQVAVGALIQSLLGGRESPAGEVALQAVELALRKARMAAVGDGYMLAMAAES